MFKLIRFSKKHCMTHAHEWGKKKKNHVLYVGKSISNHKIFFLTQVCFILSGNMSLFPLNSVQNFRPVSALVFDTYRGFKMECGPYFPVTTGSTEKVKSLLLYITLTTSANNKFFWDELLRWRWNEVNFPGCTFNENQLASGIVSETSSGTISIQGAEINKLLAILCLKCQLLDINFLFI